MPRTPKDYSKCAFYRLVCRDITVTECYVGHTTNIVDRRYKHKSSCTNEKAKGYNLSVYQFIRRMGGWDNWQLLVIEQLAVFDDVAARLRERHWCEHYKATLNSNVPYRTREERVAYFSKYRAEHVEEAAVYRANNADKIKIKNTVYHAAHREERIKRTAAYGKAHEAHLKEQHDCPCKGKYTTSGKSRHFKTALHCAYLAALPAV